MGLCRENLRKANISQLYIVFRKRQYSKYMFYAHNQRKGLCNMGLWTINL